MANRPFYDRRISTMKLAVPTKAYICTSGVNTYSRLGLDPEIGSMRHLREIYERHSELFGDREYAIAILWSEGEDNPSMADIFGFKKATNWTDNREWNAWVFRNGVLVPNAERSCQIGLFTVTVESQAQRRTKDLEEFMRTDVNLLEHTPRSKVWI